MKVRKLAVALALAGGLGSGVAQALGLGEIELQSYLNQPLNAEIDVNRVGGVSPSDILVNLASERDYQRVGLRRDYFLTQLNFNVTTAPNGELVVSVTSKEPVREPYLNFLVEVTWPSGRVMREYSVLVDPPVYAEQSGAPEPVQAAPSAARPSAQPAPTAQPSSRSQSASSSTAGPRTLGPVQASDTLWKIAQQVRPDDSVSMQQVMLAIQDLNPDAFIDGNINRLKRGAVLRVPEMADIRNRTRAQANREATAQNRAFAQPSREVDATDTARTEGSGSAAGQGQTDELRLVVPGDDADTARSEGSAGGDGRQGGVADSGSAVALEELDRVQRENDELNSRMEDLQDQVETLQRLIELKDSQLAELQEGLGAEEPPAGSDSAATEMSAESGQPGPTGLDTAATDEMAGEQGEADADPTEATDGAQSMADDGQMMTAADGAEEDAMSSQPMAEDQGGAATDDSLSAANDDGMMDSAAEPAMDDTAAASAPEAEPTQPAPVEQPASQPPKSFLDTAIELISGNVLYQAALGGFLVLLLLLGLLFSRRRANKEDDFYSQLDQEGDADDSFELSLEDEASTDAETDVLEEADRYLSYSQHEAASELLENAISREPSRSDLRLKLLAVYADIGNRSAFDKQYAELEAMELDDAMPEADALRTRLEEMESTPSIDDLESELRGGGEPADDGDSLNTGFDQQPAPEADDDVGDLVSSFEELDLPDEMPSDGDASPSEDSEQTSDDGLQPIDYDLSDFDREVEESDAEAGLDSEDDQEDRTPAYEEGEGLADIEFEFPGEETVEESPAEAASDELNALDESSGLELSDDLESLEESDFDLDATLEDTETGNQHDAAGTEPNLEDELDFGDLGLDDNEEPALDEQDDRDGLSGVERGGEAESETDSSSDSELDESFLDELDAELDKVTGATDDDDDGLDELDDLELDVSDEDLALMDEVSEAELEDESQLDLGDLELDEPGLDSMEPDQAGESESDPGSDSEEDLTDLDIPELDAAVDGGEESADQAQPASPKAKGIDDIDEAALDDDDDFDFLSGSDEVATKLDLARAYVDMGDSEGAREILEEVILEGTEEQKGDAQSLLKKLP